MDNYFEFTGETLGHGGVTLRRIRATKDLPRHGVRAGDVGGWLQRRENLSENAWVFGDAKVFKNAHVSMNAKVFGNAEVFGDALVYGDAEVFGYAMVYGNAEVYGNAKVYGYARVFGNAKVFIHAKVFETAKVYGTAKVCENATVFGNARVYENAHVFENAKVLGNAGVVGNAVVFGNAEVFENAGVCGNAQVYENAKVFGNALVQGTAVIFENALVEERNHVLEVKNVGSELVSVTLFRTTEGHHLKVGCWEGTLETLMDEVSRRRKRWSAPKSDQKAWVAQYEAIVALGKATLRLWGQEDTVSITYTNTPPDLQPADILGTSLSLLKPTGVNHEN